uniref:Uncharacterized protein n=1 Tax=Ditylenchus dipsaci TaxID=166011 RepID=A0A915D613_9BILA
MASGMASPSSLHKQNMAINVKWAEYQTLLLPFMSLVVVAILILRWSETDLRLDAVYEHVANLSPELMQTIEDFYENQSEAMSTCTSEDHRRIPN